MFNGNMNAKMIKHDGKSGITQTLDRCCFFWQQTFDPETIHKNIYWATCRKIIHTEWYIYYTKVFQWADNQCLMCLNESIQNNPWYLCQETGGVKIPIRVTHNPASFYALLKDKVPPLTDSGVYMHYYCYMSYAASYNYLEPDRNPVDSRFVKFCKENQECEWDLCAEPLNPKDVMENQYFIKSIRSSFDEENGDPKDIVAIECRNCINKYFESWKNQTYDLDSHYETGQPVTTNSMHFSLNLPMIVDVDVADRREHFYKPPNDFGPDSQSFKKRVFKGVSKLSYNNIDIMSQESDSVERRKDGRPKRALKRPLHHDEKYPPDEQTPKKKRLPRSGSRTDMVVVLPKASHKQSIKKEKEMKDKLELDSDDEDYKRANKKVQFVKGHSSTTYLIKKYVNKIKYCFDKLRVLAAENYTNDIELTEKDMELAAKTTQSNRFWYVDYDHKSDELNLVLSRTVPFVGKDSIMYRQEAPPLHTNNDEISIPNSSEYAKDMNLNLNESVQPIEFFKFDPDDVYGSFKNTDKVKNEPSNAANTPIARELLQGSRKISNDLDMFGQKERADSCDTEKEKFKSEEKKKVSNKEIDDENEEDKTVAFINLEIYQYTHPRKEEGLKEEGCSEDNYVNKFFHKHDIKNIEVIRLRAYFGYYHKIQSLYDDIIALLKWTLSHRCKNMLAKYYITEIMHSVHTLFRDKTRIGHFKRLYSEDLDHKFDINELLQVKGRWSKDPGEQRKYISVSEYIPVVDKEGTLARFDTTKTSVCSGSCWDEYAKLGPIASTEDYWESDCPCRKSKVEWSDNCGCAKNSNCKNREIRDKNFLELGKDVDVGLSWGLDVFTWYNIMYLLPTNLDFWVKYDFIMHTLQKSVMCQGANGWDIKECLKYIVSSNDIEYTTADKEISEIMLSAIETRPDIQEKYLKIHCKGLGVRWQKKQGIKANEFIIEYFGEIYPSWRWYEKEDVIKSGQNKNKLSKELPDFYNIIFERHHDDPEGYNCLTVDPILKGSYASRLSHSCFPNCATVIHVNNGTYSIGMFATRDIQYGEELTFDYKSVTESEKEYESAICLWGSFKCLGRFLGLSHSKKFTAIMKQSHTFLDRNYLIWYACKYPMITDEDQYVLNKHGIKSSLITPDVPFWLTKWASLTLRFCEYEILNIIEPLKSMNFNYTDHQCMLEAKNIMSNRISNIAITIDKVKHCLKSMGTNEAPLRTLTFRETFQKFIEGPSSFRHSLLMMLEKLEESKVKKECIRLFWNVSDISINDTMDDDQCKAKYMRVLEILKELSMAIRKIKSRVIFTEALADILYLYSHTFTYFTATEAYKKFTGEEVWVRKCEVTCEPKNKEIKSNLIQNEEERTVFKGAKEYETTYIWGQLAGWYKQSVEKPNASLSADRRGTLSYPDLESFDLQKPHKKSNRPRHRKSNRDFSYDTPSEDESSKGERRRGRRKLKSSTSAKLQSVNEEEGDEESKGGLTPNDGFLADDDIPQVTIIESQLKDDDSDSDSEIYNYPNKRHLKRKDFMDAWKGNFSKPWDVIWKWNFKNKQKMYGSVQFESLIKSDINFDEGRLSYFHQIVDDLLSFKQ